MLRHLFVAIYILFNSVQMPNGSQTVLSHEMKEHTSNPPSISLATTDEVGQRLIINGVVVDSITNEPIENARIYLYQADAKGEYRPVDPDDESTAKLSGKVVTRDSGQFVVHTILPGEYNMPGNRHIHLHYVRADGYENMGGVILFEDDVNDEVRQWATDTGFGTIIDLIESGGVLVGHVTIRLTPLKE